MVIVAISQRIFQCIMHAWFSRGRSHLSKTHCKFLGGWDANIQHGVTALPPSLNAALHGRVYLYRICYIDPRKFFQLCMHFIDVILLIPNNFHSVALQTRLVTIFAECTLSCTLCNVLFLLTQWVDLGV